MPYNHQNPLLNFYHHLVRDIVSVIFPDKCLICGEFSRKGKRDKWQRKNVLDRAAAGTDFRQMMSEFLCEKCTEGYVPITSPFCSKCGIVFQSAQGGDRLCSRCIKQPMFYRYARAAAVFEGPVIDIIHKLKYNGKIQLARPLSVLLFSAFLNYVETCLSGDDKIDYLIPVPLHMKRFRKRGFNQAYLLVRNWQQLAHISGHEPNFKRIDLKILSRKKYTDTQTGLGRDERKKNIRNAFYLEPSSDIKGKGILLVDDVYTTGATVNECARTLVRGGACFVDVLTLARTV